jgi:hypothetical protein
MAIVKKGSNLTTALQQPGNVVSNDGYGLLTSTVSWVGDDTGTPILKGSAHPEFSFMKAWKIAREYRSLEYIGHKVEYVGICTEAAGDAENPGLWTEATNTIANISGAASLATEGITSHPKFFNATSGSPPVPDLNAMIAGYGTGTASAPVYPASTLVTTPEQEYVGLNGAHFKKVGTTYQFTGFKDPNATYRAFYGKSNYLAPTTGLSGIIYTSDDDVVQRFIANVGRSSLLNGWDAGPLLVPNFMGTDWEGAFGAQLLLSGVNFEQYGHVYKCSYQIRINKEGWPVQVYPLFV